jgi:uridine phosphorylase
MARFPNHPGKVSERALFDPADLLAYQRAAGVEAAQPPDALIILFQRGLLRQIVERFALPVVDVRPFRMARFEQDDGRIAVAHFPVGAAAATLALEHAVAWGVRRLVTVGTAGSLQRSIPIGSLVVCERAIRDEGTSHHYAESAKYASAAPELSARLAETLGSLQQEYRVGTAWTTDAPYRETRAEVRSYAAEGVAVVDMEAAALFTVAAYRGAEAAALFSVSDSLAEGSWQPAFGAEHVREGLLRGFEAARATLAATLPARP